MLEPAQGTLGEYVATTSKPSDWLITAEGASNFNSPALKKGLELQKALEESGALIKYPDAVAGKITLQNEFLTGKAAMAPAASYLIRYIKDTKNFPHDFPVVFAPYPQYEKDGKVNPGGGLGDYLSINKNSPHKEAAMKFMSWYLTDGVMEMAPGGRIPSNQKIDFDKISSLLIGDAEKLIDKASLQALLSDKMTYPSSNRVPAPAELRAVYKEEMEKYLFGVQPIDKTLEIMKTRADAIIKNAKK
ncbi:extracellular solute-binding protein [Paenibacillus sp. CC-CFT747]|nr:extracellular solute-binding protein [Paenibacillus sp. CC-CFT747]